MLIGQGKNVPEVCKEIEISQQIYYRWRQKYGGMSPDMIKQLKAVRFDTVVQNIEGWVVYVDPQMLDRELFLHIDELRPDLPCRGML